MKFSAINSGPIGMKWLNELGSKAEKMSGSIQDLRLVSLITLKVISLYNLKSYFNRSSHSFSIVGFKIKKMKYQEVAN